MNPAESLRHFAIACAIGVILGLYYGFLRPWRPKYTHWGDFFFVLGMLWAWLWLNFGVCRGDLRVGCNLGLLVGGFFWELTFGRLLRPIFRWFWRLMGRIAHLFFYPFWFILKKIQIFFNFLLKQIKKGSTIKCNIR